MPGAVAGVLGLGAGWAGVEVVVLDAVVAGVEALDGFDVGVFAAPV